MQLRRERLWCCGAGLGRGAGGRARSTLAIERVTASSTLPAWKGYRFDASQLSDGKLDTSWQRLSKMHGGVGQWTELTLPGAAMASSIEIANALQKTDKLGDLFVLNNRVRKARLVFSDGSEVALDLRKDARGLVKKTFLPRVTTSVRLVVDGIHRGDKWNDLAISEQRLSGRAGFVRGGAAGLLRDPAAAPAKRM